MVRRLEKAGGPGRVRKIGELASVARDPGEGKKQGNQR